MIGDEIVDTIKENANLEKDVFFKVHKHKLLEEVKEQIKLIKDIQSAEEYIEYLSLLDIFSKVSSAPDIHFFMSTSNFRQFERTFRRDLSHILLESNNKSEA